MQTPSLITYDVTVWTNEQGDETWIYMICWEFDYESNY